MKNLRKREKIKLIKKILEEIKKGRCKKTSNCPAVMLDCVYGVNGFVEIREQFCHKLFPTLSKSRVNFANCGVCPCCGLTEKYVKARLRRFIRTGE